jgi:hypothetical protein
MKLVVKRRTETSCVYLAHRYSIKIGLAGYLWLALFFAISKYFKVLSVANKALTASLIPIGSSYFPSVFQQEFAKFGDRFFSL